VIAYAMLRIALLLVLAACQSSNDTRQFAVTDSPADCEKLTALYCNVCDASGVQAYDDCIEELNRDMPCEASKQTGPDLERCMHDLEDWTCWGPLPSACVGVLRY
jgi:hypothetical protein